MVAGAGDSNRVEIPAGEEEDDVTVDDEWAWVGQSVLPGQPLPGSDVSLNLSSDMSLRLLRWVHGFIQEIWISFKQVGGIRFIY